MSLDQLTNTGFLDGGCLVVRVEVQLEYDSKRETGFLGMEEGPGYMTALLQILYHTPFIRKLIYHLPTSGVDNNNNSNSKNIEALQKIFYYLQHGNTSVREYLAGKDEELYQVCGHKFGIQTGGDLFRSLVRCVWMYGVVAIF